LGHIRWIENKTITGLRFDTSFKLVSYLLRGFDRRPMSGSASRANPKKLTDRQLFFLRQFSIVAEVT